MKNPENETVSKKRKNQETAGTIGILNAADEELLRLSRTMTLSLNLEEMRAIRRHFIGLRRDPTDIELETLAQTWSEHCKHKIFTSSVDFTLKKRNATTTCSRTRSGPSPGP